MLLTGIADERGGSDPVTKFVRQMARAVRRAGGNGNAADNADARHLDAAERHEVGAVLVAGVEQARTDRHGSRAELGILAAAWMEFARTG